MISVMYYLDSGLAEAETASSKVNSACEQYFCYFLSSIVVWWNLVFVFSLALLCVWLGVFSSVWTVELCVINWELNGCQLATGRCHGQDWQLFQFKRDFLHVGDGITTPQSGLQRANSSTSPPCLFLYSRNRKKSWNVIWSTKRHLWWQSMSHLNGSRSCQTLMTGCDQNGICKPVHQAAIALIWSFASIAKSGFGFWNLMSINNP